MNVAIPKLISQILLDNQPTDWFGVELIVITAILPLLMWGFLCVFRRVSAGTRHRLWLFTFVGLSMAPALLFLVPTIRLPLLPAPVTPVAQDTRDLVSVSSYMPTVQDTLSSNDNAGASREPYPTTTPHATTITQNNPQASARFATATSQSATIDAASLAAPSLIRFTVLMWLGTAVTLLLTWLTVSSWNRRRLLRHARLLDAGVWPEHAATLCKQLGLKRTPDIFLVDGSTIPLTWGVHRPIIVLPCQATMWDADRRSIVLKHELAHIQRRDTLSQLFARVVCTIYWFQPLAWLSLRQMRIEREKACDDRVIALGQRPTEYAMQLIGIARELKSPAGLLAISMAGSTLEKRFHSLFDDRRSHRPASGKASAVAMAGMVVVLMTLVCIRVGYQSTQSDAPGVPVPQENQPSAEEIINDYLEALGGRTALENIRSMQLEWTISQATGLVNWSHEEFLWQGDRWKTNFVHENNTSSVGAVNRRFWYDKSKGAPGWYYNSWMLWQHRVNDRSFRKPLRWHLELNAMTVLGMQVIDGKQTWAVQFWYEERGFSFDEQIIRYFDTESGLLVKTDCRCDPMPVQKVFRDYREVEGIRIPHEILVNYSTTTGPLQVVESSFVRRIEDIVLNQNIEPPQLVEPAAIAEDPDKVMLQGVVRDEQTGDPVPNIRICSPNPYGWEVITFTDDAGRFILHEHKKTQSEIEHSYDRWRNPDQPEWIIVPPVYAPFRSIARTRMPVPADKGELVEIELQRTRMLRGQLVDAETGQGVRGRVECFMDLGDIRRHDINPWVREWSMEGMYPYLTRKTDPDGRFQLPVLDGLNTLHFDVTGSGRRFYLINEPRSFFNHRMVIDVNDTAVLDGHRIELKPSPARVPESPPLIYLSPGTHLAGQIVNRKTGEPVVGRVSFRSANPETEWIGADIDSTGRFRLDVDTRIGVLTVWAKPPGIFQRFQYVYGQSRPSGNAVYLVDVDEDAGDEDLEISLVPTDVANLCVVDMAGESVDDFAAIGQFRQNTGRPSFVLDPRAGQNGYRVISERHSEHLQLFGMSEKTSRMVLAMQPERGIGAARVIRPESTRDDILQPLTLQPLGSIVFRLVNSSGGAWVRIKTRVPGFQGNNGIVVQEVSIEPGEEFVFSQLIPGLKYEILIHDFDLQQCVAIDVVEPGQTIDLGEIDLAETGYDPRNRFR
ncbi:MAG: M56 family metallopeptidase [Pirellulaceae bacterium]